MKNRTIHPLWTHVPAIGVFIYLVIRLAIASPLPARAALNFTAGGRPNDYSSPWIAFGLALGLGLFFILLAIASDEIWARQEKQKTFNWMACFDEVIVGFLTALSLGYLDYLSGNEALFVFPWRYIVILPAVAIILSLLLEAARPFRLYPRRISSQDTSALQQEISRRLHSQDILVYWESQNPLWNTILAVLVPILMLVGAVLTWSEGPWVSLILILVGILLASFYGGLRVTVDRKYLSVRLGILGLRVLHLKLEDISGLEIKEFSPMNDFGGYGIRFNKQMMAFYLAGTSGLVLTTSLGKRYLIGSNQPENLRIIIGSLKQ